MGYRNTPFEMQGFNKDKLKEAKDILNKGNYNGSI